MESTETLQVATALILRDGRYLLTQRGDRSDFPWLWESPGGKVEGDEGAECAVRRELHEEVGLPWVPPSGVREFWSTRFAAGDVNRSAVSISFFQITVEATWTPRVSPHANVVGCGWFSLDEMARVELVPGNVRLLEHLRSRARVRQSPAGRPR